jgi:hypothetical protein
MQELKILEDGFEQSILHEEQTTAGTTGHLTSLIGDVNLLGTPLVEQKATKYEVLSYLSLHLTIRLTRVGGTGAITEETR